jgi:hypothetical protein
MAQAHFLLLTFGLTGIPRSINRWIASGFIKPGGLFSCPMAVTALSPAASSMPLLHRPGLLGATTGHSSAPDRVQALLTMWVPTVLAPSGEEADWNARSAD